LTAVLYLIPAWYIEIFAMISFAARFDISIIGRSIFRYAAFRRSFQLLYVADTLACRIISSLYYAAIYLQ